MTNRSRRPGTAGLAALALGVITGVVVVLVARRPSREAAPVPRIDPAPYRPATIVRYGSHLAPRGEGASIKTLVG